MESDVTPKPPVKKVSKAAAEKKAAPPPPPQTASQKLEALENAYVQQNNQINILADEIDRLRQTVVALNKRLNASIQAAEGGGVSNESVNKIIMSENVKELESKITFLTEQGVLLRNDEAEITDNTFVVGRELDQEGNVTNPRVQFAVKTVEKEVKDKLYTKKAGDVIAYSENEDSLEITEVYEIVNPKIKKNFEKQQSTPQ